MSEQPNETPCPECGSGLPRRHLWFCPRLHGLSVSIPPPSEWGRPWERLEAVQSGHSPNWNLMGFPATGRPDLLGVDLPEAHAKVIADIYNAHQPKERPMNEQPYRETPETRDCFPAIYKGDELVVSLNNVRNVDLLRQMMSQANAFIAASSTPPPTGERPWERLDAKPHTDAPDLWYVCSDRHVIIGAWLNEAGARALADAYNAHRPAPDAEAIAKEAVERLAREERAHFDTDAARRIIVDAIRKALGLH